MNKARHVDLGLAGTNRSIVGADEIIFLLFWPAFEKAETISLYRKRLKKTENKWRFFLCKMTLPTGTEKKTRKTEHFTKIILFF